MNSSRVSAVLDTNLIVSAFIFQRGGPYTVLSALYQGSFDLILSESLQGEYADVLGRSSLIERYNIDARRVGAFFRFIRRHGSIVTPAENVSIVVRDPKDMQVLATALGGDADYLVSGDADLLSLADDPRLGPPRIVTARAFLDVLGLA